MTTTVQYQSSCSVYPGGFVPMMKDDEIMQELKCMQQKDIIHPTVQVTELPDSFMAEVSIPGVTREEMLIQADENVLSIYAVHKGDVMYVTDSFQLHKLKCDCFDQHIILPKNADTEFTSAEYKAGILTLHVPKINQPVKNRHARIIVY